MKLIGWFRSVAAKVFRHAEIATEMDEELRAHIQLRADDLERSGVSPAEVLRRARIEFGAYEKFREESHQALGGNLIETFVHDVRFALRVLRKSPGFTFAAIATLALAVGANAVVFGLMDGLILRPLNVPRDPVVLAGVVFAMALLGLIATWIPAQRALSLDPLALLREE